MMMDYGRENTVYSDLYNIVKENMENAGKKMEFKEQTFLSTIGEESQVANILRWEHCDLDSFLENAFFQLLERMPDKVARSRWSEKTHKRDGEKKRKILISILNSQEYMMKNTYYKNNIYGNIESNKVGLKIRIRNRLVRIGRTLPLPLKQFVKKICGIK